jgi:hypothetical protein
MTEPSRTTDSPDHTDLKWHQQLRWRLAIAAALVLLAVGWRAGTFDGVLVHVGLNAKPCVKNAYGATFCGSSATSYCESLPHGGNGVKMCEQIGAVSPAAAIQQGQQSLEETEHTDEQQSQEAMQHNAQEAARAYEEQKARTPGG